MTSVEDRRRELIARRLAAAGLNRAAGRLDDTPARSREGRFPLSFAQRRMWLHHKIVPGSTAYNLCIELTFDGEVREDALRAAFTALAARHEVFRTTYHEDAGAPYQQVHDQLAWELTSLDLTGSGDARARVRELARELASRPYDLERESSLRVAIVQEAARRWTVLLQVHHIAWDGLTFAAISRDLETFYRQALTGPVDPVLPRRQVADFAAAEQRAWESDGREAELEYWRERLADPAPALFHRLPGQDPAAQPEAGARIDRRMSDAAARAVRTLAAQLGTTPYTVVLGCYVALLSRFGGTADVAVGTAVLNREESGAVELAGNFGNVVVLRAPVHPHDTFRTLTDRLREVTAAGFARQGYPYDQLVEHLNPDRGAVGGSLFDAQLLFLTQHIDGPQLPGARTTWRRTDNGTAQHPLALEVFLTGAGLDVEATYALADLTAELVRSLLDELDGLLVAAARNPDLALAELMRRGVTGSTAAPVALVEPTLSAAALLRARAAAEPDAVALAADGSETSYAELDARVDRFAQLLRSRGVGPEMRVGVLLPRSADLVVALLGVLRAGGVLVPVDPSYPEARIRLMLTDAAPVLLVTNEPRDGIPVLEVASAESDSESGAELPEPHPDQAAYLIYTSGSTGRPKGVVGTHRGLANRLAWAGLQWPVEPGQVRIAKSSVSFIDGLTELFAALAGGARVVVADDRTATDVGALAALLARERVGQLTAVPSLVAALPEARVPVLADMRRWVCSGEPLPRAVASAARELAPGSVVVNSYGSSEVAGDVLAGEVEPDGPVTVGRPVPGAGVHLLDRFLVPVPDGAVGEVYVGGVQVARGYSGRPGETAARFVADPWQPGARLYRTGDLARRMADGRYVLLGRADDQVTIRGVRVEPGEVEAVLAALPGVTSAAVVVRDDLPGGPALLAYAVSEPGVRLDPAALLDGLRDRLPRQLVPAQLVPVEELPRTPSGKLDRRALPQPVSDGTARGPRDERERTLCALFEELLGRTGIGIDDDFFALGGHSLSALRLANRIQERIGAQTSVPDVFAAPTVAALAARLRTEPQQVQERGVPEPGGQERGVPEPPTRVRRRPAGSAPVLGPAQRQMWTLYRLEGPAATYNVPRAWTVTGPLDVDAFRAALADVVARHEILRTTYREDGADGRPAHPPAGRAAPPRRVRRSRGCGAPLVRPRAGGPDPGRHRPRRPRRAPDRAGRAPHRGRRVVLPDPARRPRDRLRRAPRRPRPAVPAACADLLGCRGLAGRHGGVAGRPHRPGPPPARLLGGDPRRRPTGNDAAR